MKYRSSFVSNSSSSSFIITNKDKQDLVRKIIDEADVCADYLELDGTLYTSIIYDGDTELYNRLSDLADNEVSTGHSTPYDEDEFYEFQDKYGDNLSIYDGDEIGQCIGLWAENYLTNYSIEQAKPIVLSDIQSRISAEDFNKLVKTCGSIKFLFDGYYS